MTDRTHGQSRRAVEGGDTDKRPPGRELEWDTISGRRVGAGQQEWGGGEGEGGDGMDEACVAVTAGRRAETR